MTDHIDNARALIESLTGYTPGPWKIHNCESYVERGISFHQEIWCAETDILVTSEVTRAHNDGGARNMRLIAAAPDLHAALTGALDEIERLRGHLESIADAFGCECGDQARAALKGGTNAE